MKRPTRAWVEKAEGDLLIARQSLAAAEPVFDGICFHAQQCVEKYLKAALQEYGIRSAATHDLSLLQALVDTHAPGLDEFTADLQWLTTYAMEIRYPGVSANAGEADRALRIAIAAREVLRGALGIPDEEPTE
jgi:HEPN domain-containing protein